MPKFLQQLVFSRELNFLFLSVFLFAATLGINLVTFPTILNKHGVSGSLIGIAFTLDILGGILTSFFLSKIVARLTMMRTLKFSVFCYAAIILTIFFYQNFYLWAVLAFVMGSLWFIYVITRQSWLNMLLENNQRGVALGIFSMAISAGIALGPVIASFSGAENYLSFLISATLAIASFFCLLPLKNKPQPQLESQRISLKDFFKTNPRIFLARFFLDFQTYLLLTFSVIFGVKIGLSYEAAGLLISAYMFSGFCDVWVGFALKKWNPYQLINLGFLGCLCCFLAIIFIHNYHFLLGTYFTFGVFIACIYVSVFKVSNDDYAKSKLVAANATFQLVGSIGAISGSLVGGLLFHIFDAVGFPITMVLSCVSYLTFLVIYEKKK
ncbi:MAG: MFS transporter [Rickettsiales bacterium]|nr:MFS transporter [Rickettsiales bacterium]